ncbi:GNAT family N-acetyltransferase [Metabacillus arenae]|uniref:GNAT family N-acetyltransferase n=1 Tax=Metabacillus arenae TaxID=2771434 RepID=A0A926NPE2_9BACI|nr:GNAT family N-acetyltransferase [Metabacillus arenae]MBD1381642.1 GNAT family N-acetyltransferase [Metabacillus arenae]
MLLQQELIKSFNAKNGQEVILRPVRKSDAEDIIEAVKSILDSGLYIQKEAPRTIEEERAFIDKIKKNDHMYTAAELDGKVVGIARVMRGELEMKRHTGLFRTWLHETVQGLGIGKELMNYTLEWCKIHQLHKLCLTVFTSNDIATKLYERVGFIIEGVQKEQVYLNGEYDDEMFMAYFFE